MQSNHNPEGVEQTGIAFRQVLRHQACNLTALQFQHRVLMNMSTNKPAEKSLLIGEFRQRWLEVSGEYVPVGSEGDVSGQLLEIIKHNNIKSVVLAQLPLLPELYDLLKGEVEALADFGRNKYNRDEATELCSRAEAGITSADALISETGTLAMSFYRRCDRLISSLPPLHIVVAFDVPVYRDMDAFLCAAPTELSLSFITGPSRTADIEKRLVLGAHGPRRVIVLGPES